MIPVQELRFGNWVLPFDGSKEPEQISFGKFRSIEGGANNLQPIPLTPEILEKCGLLEGGKFAPNEYFSLQDGCLYLEQEYTCVDIKYLHQLQNVFFALTGEELNYKPWITG